VQTRGSWLPSARSRDASPASLFIRNHDSELKPLPPTRSCCHAATLALRAARPACSAPRLLRCPFPAPCSVLGFNSPLSLAVCSPWPPACYSSLSACYPVPIPLMAWCPLGEYFCVHCAEVIYTWIFVDCILIMNEWIIGNHGEVL
jgi:hypothetical protein